MKKLFLNIFLLILISGLILYLYDRWIFKLDTQVYRFSKELKTISKVKIVSIGNSEGIRLKLGASKPDDVADLCLTGTDLFTIEEVFESIAAGLPKSKIVMLNVNNTTLYYNSKHATDSLSLNDLDIHSQMLYYNLPLKDVRLDILPKFIKSRFCVINKFSNTELGFTSGLKVVLPQSIYKKIKNKEKTEDEENQQPMGGKFDKKGQSQKTSIISSVGSYPTISKQAIKTLYKIKHIAEANHLVLIAYSMPRHRRYIDIFGQAMFDSTSANVNNALKSLNILYFDHLSDPEFIDNYTYFIDCAHLNKRGAQKLDAKLFYEAEIAFPQFSDKFKALAN